MGWWAIGSIFMLSTVKFMVAPFSGPLMGLSFVETYMSSIAGAIFSSAIFYYSASYFMDRTADRKRAKDAKMRAQGLPVKIKKNFTRTNKIIVKIKRSIGIVGISILAPFFLSIPLGSIIVAKFYGHHKKTFSLILIGICVNGMITTGLAYYLYG